MLDNRLSRIAILATFLCVTTLAFMGCGERKASRPPADSDLAPKGLADPENPDVPQPINAWGEFVGDDVLLHWLDGAEGDYNVDGRVDGKDVFPLALRFNKPTDYSDSQQAEQPLDNCIDGNRDGTLDGLDLFTIAVHFNEEVRGYRIYDSLDGAEAAELTTAEIDRESGVGLCRPEHEWTAEGKALEDGLHVFYLTAVAEYKQPSVDEGTAVTLDVRNDPGFPQGAIWPARYHDRRNSYRSQFKGPRDYDPATVEYFPYSNGSAHPSWRVGASETAIVGFTTQGDYDIEYELSSFDLGTGEFGWNTGETSAGYGTASLNMLDSGDVLTVSRLDYDSFVLYHVSREGELLSTITLPDDLGISWISYGSTVLTANQNFFLQYMLEDVYWYALWSLDGEEIWSVPSAEPIVGFDTPPLALSNGLIVVGDAGNLVALRESDGGVEWSYPLKPDFKIYLSLTADSEDNVYYGLSIGSLGQSILYGVVSPAGEEISRSDISPGRLDHFVALDDGTALLIYKEDGGFTGYFKRVYADSLEPMWEKSGNLYALLLIDSERYLYMRGNGNSVCWTPDGDTVFTAPYYSFAFLDGNGNLYGRNTSDNRMEKIPARKLLLN